MTPRKKRILRWALGAVAVPLLWMGGVAISIVAGATANPGARADAAVVLGAAVWDGEPSPVFAERIHHALGLFERGQVRVLIFTGGIGEDDQLSEGAVARQYALARGVPAEAILVESESKTTRGNLAGAQSLMKQAGLSSAVIVSDPYHLRRAGMIADRLGMKHECSPTQTSRYSGFGAKTGLLLRESWFVTKLLVTGK